MKPHHLTNAKRALSTGYAKMIAVYQYRLTLPGKGVWDYNPRRNTVKLVGTSLDIKVVDVREWVKNKLAE